MMPPRPSPPGGLASGGWPGFTEVLDVLDEAVTIRDRDGNIAYANKTALMSMGFNSLEEMQNRPTISIMDDYLVEDEQGRPITHDDVPSIRIMRGETAPRLVMRTVSRDTGAVSWRQLRASPLTDAAGELVAVVTVIEDVTDVKLAEMRMSVLAESGRILASSLDYQETLRNVANVAVPALADWCTVDLVDRSLRRERVVVAHQDPERVAVAQEARRFEPDELDPQGTWGRVLRTGISELFEDIGPEQIAAGSHNEEHRQLLESLEIRSALVVPLRVPTRTIGVMTLVTAESRRRLTEDDRELAEQLGRRAAVAVENARLHTTLSSIADTLQRSLLPGELPVIEGWELAALYQPAGGEQRIDVGGDFYEVFCSNGVWFVVMGDVTGKGVTAATLTALLRYGSQFASRHDPRPGAILRQLDEALRGRGKDSLCTALCLTLGERRIEISSGGHPPALVISGDGRVQELPPTGPLLGAFDNGQWPDQTVELTPGDTVLLYTDGVTEAPGDGQRFGVERLKQIMSENARCAPAELLSRLDARLAEFRTVTGGDDVAVLALRPRG
jgi:PAS domain S-box-containing protein